MAIFPHQSDLSIMICFIKQPLGRGTNSFLGSPNHSCQESWPNSEEIFERRTVSKSRKCLHLSFN